MKKMEKIEQKYLELSKDKKRDFIAYLIFFFSILARDSYIYAGKTSQISASCLRVYNEVTHTLSQQLITAIGIEPIDSAYPDEMIFKILEEYFGELEIEEEDFIFPFYRAFEEVYR